MKITFEEFLRDWHMKDYIGIYDDAPDAFDDWVSALEFADLEPLADLYGKEMYLRGIERAEQIARETLKV